MSVCEGPIQYRVLIDWNGTGDVDDVLLGDGRTRQVALNTSVHDTVSVSYAQTPVMNIAAWVADSATTYTLPGELTQSGVLSEGASSTGITGSRVLTAGSSTGELVATCGSFVAWVSANIIVYGIGGPPTIEQFEQNVATSAVVGITTAADMPNDVVLVAVQGWKEDIDHEMSSIPESDGITWTILPAATGSGITATTPAMMAWIGIPDTGGAHEIRFPTSANPDVDNHAFLYVLRRPVVEFPPVTPGEDVTDEVLRRQSITAGRGRDQARTLSPPRSGESAFELCNVDRDFSPENTSSPFYGQLQPGKQTRVQALYEGVLYPLFHGHIDDFDVTVNRGDRSVQLSCVDTIAALQAETISTELYQGIRSGAAVHVVLDAINWPQDRRDIDGGASVFPWWWEENTDGLEAVTRILRSEGPPSVAYLDASGVFVFRDRHHRLLRDRSLVSQGRFVASRIECTTASFNSVWQGETFEEFNNFWGDATFAEFNEKPLAGGDT